MKEYLICLATSEANSNINFCKIHSIASEKKVVDKHDLTITG